MWHPIAATSHLAASVDPDAAGAASWLVDVIAGHLVTTSMLPPSDAPVVSERRSEATADHEGLAELLSALAYPARLELLEILRFPHALSEIRLSPRRAGPTDSPDRVAARTTVQAHLEKLVDTDLVRVDDAPAPTGRAQRYSVNPQRLYAVLEDMRRLSFMRSRGGASAEMTGTLDELAAPAEMTGPRLVLVHGVYEGKSFPLDADSAIDGRWIVGRRRGLPIMLDYDPWVSVENCAISRDAGGFVVADIRGSKNGTFLNWRRVTGEAPRRLRPGDVLGVGRSLLVFATDE